VFCADRPLCILLQHEGNCSTPATVYNKCFALRILANVTISGTRYNLWDSSLSLADVTFSGTCHNLSSATLYSCTTETLNTALTFVLCSSVLHTGRSLRLKASSGDYVSQSVRDLGSATVNVDCTLSLWVTSRSVLVQCNCLKLHLLSHSVLTDIILSALLSAVNYTYTWHC